MRFFETAWLLVVVVLVVGGCTLAALAARVPCRSWEMIEEVGGCDHLGICGVRYESGRVGDVTRPIRGQQVCVDRYSPWESDR